MMIKFIFPYSIIKYSISTNECYYKIECFHFIYLKNKYNEKVSFLISPNHINKTRIKTKRTHETSEFRQYKTKLV